MVINKIPETHYPHYKADDKFTKRIALQSQRLSEAAGRGGMTDELCRDAP